MHRRPVEQTASRVEPAEQMPSRADRMPTRADQVEQAPDPGQGRALYSNKILLGGGGHPQRFCGDSDVDVDLSAVDVDLLTVLPEDMPAQTPHVLNVDSLRPIILEEKIQG
ncbi:hypothetical protein QQF64_036145 [Cirrhinus molitorella]|uniref:Uncharacterized protein n=1 Tax=Cirrhinus molitorella TaxID=172907 RepID=A0ABR3NIE3_9TELE